jgi:hypothetical protein
MAATVADVRALGATFADVDAYPDALIQTWLDLAGSFLSLPRFGSKASVAQKLWTAHYITTAFAADPDSQAWRTAGKRVGDVSVNYAAPSTVMDMSMTANNLARTAYGLLLWQLLRRYGRFALAVG